jgi:hypothetical protein
VDGEQKVRMREVSINASEADCSYMAVSTLAQFRQTEALTPRQIPRQLVFLRTLPGAD